jgi:hypothetical protein
MQRYGLLNKYQLNVDRDNFDYLYLSLEFSELAGKKFEKKRNRLKKFLHTFPDHQIIDYQRPHLEEVLSFTQEGAVSCLNLPEVYCHNIISKGLQDDLFQGFFVRVGEAIAGILFYSELNPQTIVVHTELIDPQYDGVSALLNQYLGQKVASRYKYINREQDMGLPGLRQSKLSYRPYRLLKKYDILI